MAAFSSPQKRLTLARDQVAHRLETVTGLDWRGAPGGQSWQSSPAPPGGLGITSGSGWRGAPRVRAVARSAPQTTRPALADKSGRTRGRFSGRAQHGRGSGAGREGAAWLLSHSLGSTAWPGAQAPGKYRPADSRWLWTDWARSPWGPGLVCPRGSGSGPGVQRWRCGQHLPPLQDIN